MTQLLGRTHGSFKSMRRSLRMESGFGLTRHTQYVPTFISTSLILTTYLKISGWVVAPYKKPKHNLPKNEVFNNHLSHICIQSKHAIGYLKGRFQSLKELHVQITNQKSHKFATYWVACCIGVHCLRWPVRLPMKITNIMGRTSSMMGYHPHLTLRWVPCCHNKGLGGLERGRHFVRL